MSASASSGAGIMLLLLRDVSSGSIASVSCSARIGEWGSLALALACEEDESSVKESRESHLWCSLSFFLRSGRSVGSGSVGRCRVGLRMSFFVFWKRSRAACREDSTESGVKGGVSRPCAPSANAACGISGGK